MSQKLIISSLVIAFVLIFHVNNLNGFTPVLYPHTTNSGVTKQLKTNINDKPILNSYILHEPISITSDMRLAEFAVSGNGSAIDPYILEGWQIISDDSHCIRIEGTTKHFVIRNCWLEVNITTFHSIHGIYISQAAVGTVTLISNVCENNFRGIYINGSLSSMVVNNTVRNSEDIGISLKTSGQSTVLNNNCYDNSYGIRLTDSAQSIVKNNYCEKNRFSISIENSISTILTKNTVRNSGSEGISVRNSSSSILANNTCFRDGFHISEDTLENYLTFKFENNSVNEKPFGYLTNEYDITIRSQYGQLMLINCTNVVVTDQNCSYTSTGISLLWCFSCKVFKNTCNKNLHAGISLGNCNSMLITNNLCNENTRAGISGGSDLWTFLSFNNTYSHNICQKNGEYGIDVIFPASASIDGNICNQNGYRGFKEGHAGIRVLASFNSSITNNLCHQNGYYGIYFYNAFNTTGANNSCNQNVKCGVMLFAVHHTNLTINTCKDNDEEGIGIDKSDNSTITQNICQNNTYGIWVDDSAECVIQSNIIIENRDYGVLLREGCDSNKIYLNSFIQNGRNAKLTSQAFDNGTDNLWYDPIIKEGNYWSDHNGAGSYVIAGVAGASDLYPLDKNLNPIKDNSPAIIGFSHLVVILLSFSAFLVYIIIRKCKG